MYVTVSGKILPCERIDHCFSLGQVFDDHISLDEEYVAERHNYYISRYTNQCAVCATNKFCSQCVYQINDIFKEDTRCPLFLTGKGLERKNEKIFEFLKNYPQYYKRILEEVVIRG